MGFTLSQRDAPAFFSIWDDGNHIDGRVTMGSLSLSRACCGFVFFLSFAPAKKKSFNRRKRPIPGLLLLQFRRETGLICSRGHESVIGFG